MANQSMDRGYRHNRQQPRISNKIAKTICIMLGTSSCGQTGFLYVAQGVGTAVGDDCLQRLQVDPAAQMLWSQPKQTGDLLNDAKHEFLIYKPKAGMTGTGGETYGSCIRLHPQRLMIEVSRKTKRRPIWRVMKQFSSNSAHRFSD